LLTIILSEDTAQNRSPGYTTATARPWTALKKRLLPPAVLLILFISKTLNAGNMRIANTVKKQKEVGFDK
jgi:hypothetical protein